MSIVTKFIRELTRIWFGFGPLFFAKYVFYILKYINKLLATKSLSPIDKCIIKNVIVTNNSGRFELLGEMMPTIREVLLKNCYAFDSSKRYSTIIDLGANRGIFSVMASRSAERVIAVEFNAAEFAVKFNLVMELNRVKNTVLISKYAADFCDETHITVNQIVRDYSLTEISFLKIDIEGAETDIFSSDLEWLTITKIISLEIHPCFNVDANKIISILQTYGFIVNCFNLDLVPIDDFKDVSMGYIRAHK